MTNQVSHNGSTVHDLATLPIVAHVRPTHLDTSGSPTTDPELFADYTWKDQMKKVLDTMRARDMKIAVISNEFSRTYEADKARATSIATELNKVLSGSKALVYEYTITNTNWFTYLRELATHYIFVGLPPALADQYNEKTPESDYFNPRSSRIIEAVVVRSGEWSLASEHPRGTRTTAYTPVHFLEKFLQLEGCDKEVTSMSLCQFSLSPPVPHPADKAYWSELPKVIQVPKNQSSLGLAIITREMAHKSHYPRVVLIKSFNPDCSEQLKTQLGRYTHIQSYNGVLLDGLDITAVSAIIQTSSHLNKIQLVVRYIHPIRTDTITAGLATGITTVATPITPAVEQIKETLPVQLTILGEVHKQNKELFKHLSTSLDSSSCSMSQFTSNHSSMDSTNRTATSTPIKGSEASYLRVPSQTARSETSGSGCDSYDGSDFSNDYMALSRSDKYVQRAFVPPYLFSNGGSTTTSHLPSSSPNTPARPPNSDKQYIVSMFTRGMDRRFVHLFLRQSGIYIVTVSLGDMFDEPQIQFENLLYWIRLIQGCFGPNGIRRIIIVGMKDTPLKTERERTCLDNLRGAIQETEYHVYKNQGSPIVLFDPDNVRQSLSVLCHAISRCMDLMMNRAWHMDRPFYNSIFQPFTFLNEVLCGLSCSQEVTMSADTMLSKYRNTDPICFDTLAAFSTAAISLTQNLDSLLKPDFLIELLKKLSLETDDYKDSFTHDIPMVKGLPVVLNPWPIAQISAINSHLVGHQQNSILQWAERFELLYSLGYQRNHEVYFIPLLATEFQSEATEDWPLGEDEDQWYSQPNVTVIYARLNFCAIHHFFYLLIKEALKDVVNGEYHFRSVQKCYIKLGCMEVIVPVHIHEVGLDIRVYMKYHILQNAVEFRTDSKNRQLYLYYAANHKLKASFNQSKHRNMPGGYTKAITFCIHSDNYDPALVSSSLGKLCQLSQSRSLPLNPSGIVDGEEGSDHDLLLKMIPVTHTRLKEWTSSNLEAKQKIPGDCYFRWGRHLSSDPDNWALVGSKLHLMERSDIEFYRNNPAKNGNGEMVLTKWSNSSTLTYKDLTNTLRSVLLETLADEIDSYFAATEV